ncbi:MAG: hypothetical protein SVV80_11110 [Planctomycetota bacterium]|nr:hypothetical protein [Planctomycetota bacterium]
MWEYAIVVVILLAAVAGAIYSLYRILTGRSKHHCSHCPMKNNCESNRRQ